MPTDDIRAIISALRNKQFSWATYRSVIAVMTWLGDVIEGQPRVVGCGTDCCIDTDGDCCDELAALAAVGGDNDAPVATAKLDGAKLAAIMAFLAKLLPRILPLIA